jgi:dTDP-4-amino-4,6-dideoxygalactose transaminase
MAKKPIYVTQPFMPSLEAFTKSLEQIWESKWLTNNGDFHQTFERKLADFLGVEHLSLFSNGTLALVTALQALRITGEVITTPFSFVATTHSLTWNGIKPVFCDIDPKYYCLDPHKIEALISPKTTAILPVHVYGNPCDVEKIQDIADIYGLKVIYDAAHAFNVKYKGIPVVNFGDLSILSFHSTKVFNTIEGGAIICHSAKMKQRIDYLKNFGFADELTVVAPGINAKMNELQAAYGLLLLENIEHAIALRKNVFELYEGLLDDVDGITTLPIRPDTQYNYSYFPILVDSQRYHRTRDGLYDYLKKHNIFARRYFYPLISQFPSYRGLESGLKGKLPVAENIADQVLCLPIYPGLSKDIVCEVVDLMKS